MIYVPVPPLDPSVNRCDDVDDLFRYREIFYKNLLSVLEDHKVEYINSDKGRDKEDILLKYHGSSSDPNVFNVKASYLLRYWCIDRYGYAGFSEMSRPEGFDACKETDTDTAVKWFDSSKGIVNEGSKYSQSGEFKLDDSYFFFPTQVISDKVAKLSRVEVMDLAYRLSSIFSNNPEELLVIKRHPHCNSKKMNKFINNVSADNIIFTDKSIKSILSNCKGVITVNSGVGFESLFFEVPVLTTGGSDYEWVTHSVENKNDISMGVLSGLKFDKKLVAKYLYYYCNTYAVDVTDKKRIAEKLQELSILGKSGRV